MSNSIPIFRGYDDEFKCWRYGFVTKLLEGARKIHAIISTEDDGSLVRYYIHRPLTIGMSTGVKDTNGVEIFEDDKTCSKVSQYEWRFVITKYNSTNSLKRKCVWRNFRILIDGEVAFPSGGVDTSADDNYSAVSSQDVVVGNIHEQAEVPIEKL